MGFFFSRMLRNAMLVVVGLIFVQYLLRNKSYTISPKDFRSAATKAQAPQPDSSVSMLMSSLRGMYGPWLIPDVEQQWIAVSPGGLHLRVKFFLASFTEYLAVFAAPFGTVGRSGFHWANSSCTVLSGEVHRYADVANFVNKEHFKPGDNFRQGEFQSAIFELAADTHVVCYGRGMMPISGVWLNLGSVTNADPIALVKQILQYSMATGRNCLTSLEQTFTYYKKRVTQGKSEL